jgi:hypothetical protein
MSRWISSTKRPVSDQSFSGRFDEIEIAIRCTDS